MLFALRKLKVRERQKKTEIASHADLHAVVSGKKSFLLTRRKDFIFAKLLSRF